MAKKKSNSDKDPLLKTTIYLKQSLRDEISEYQEEMGYSTFSELLRTAFRIMKQVLGSKRQNEPREPSLAEKLSSIEKRLSELQLEAKLVKKQKEMVKEEIVTTENSFDFDEVATELMSAIQDPDQFNGSVKDFTMMDYFKDKYSRGVIFYVLTELEKKGKVLLENGI